MRILHIDFSVGHEWTTQSANNFLMYGMMPGGFLEAVLRNDLYRAASCADHQNRNMLADVALSVYHNFPPGSFGNEENVKAWAADTSGQRTAWAERAEKAYTWRVLKGEEDENASRIPF